MWVGVGVGRCGCGCGWVSVPQGIMILSLPMSYKFIISLAGLKST